MKVRGLLRTLFCAWALWEMHQDSAALPDGYWYKKLSSHTSASACLTATKAPTGRDVVKAIQWYTIKPGPDGKGAWVGCLPGDYDPMEGRR